jgi:arsenate reductase-like glutaredoxin family protein
MLAIFCVSAGPAGKIAAFANSGVTDFLGEYQQQFKELFSSIDESTISEAFEFLQEKVADGSLETEAGIENAITEGKQKFDIGVGKEIDEQHIKSMIELVTTLEEMGFDSEKMVEKAKSMYEKYGVDFVDHTEELVFEAVKDSIGSAIRNAFTAFFRMIGDFFRDLFSRFR